VPGLREASHGAWEGLTLPEILAGWAAQYAAFEEDPMNVNRPGGDSYGDLAERVWPVLEEIAQRHAGSEVLVVTHGGPIRLVLSRVTGIPLTHRDRLDVTNASWFVVEGTADGGWRLVEPG